jgi:hypothetical protein|tara:strand:+ start:1629 stop:2696 length:1068 start_codon:yes stop_codon:yes gene_type:complete
MGKVENIVKNLVREMAKEGSAEEAEKDTGIPKRKQEVGKVTFSKDGDTKFTVTDINDQTGKVSWSVEYLPSYDELFTAATKLVDVAKGVRNDTKGDPVFREIFETAKVLRNKIRTHLRNEYPDEYQRIVMRLSENDLTENKLISPSKVIALNSKRADAVTAAVVKEFGIKDESRLKGVIRTALSDFMFDDELEEISTSGAAGAYLTPYAFRKKGKKAPVKAYQEFGYKLVKESKDPGATLGAGPAAGKDGVENNAYKNEFGYKLVPKNKDGSYVQKGSKLDVKQLFEDQKDFQAKRIAAFDVIEQELNDIYKMLSNAKNETSDYYNDNPSSYSVIKPTDLVLDYIKDIKDLLKGE